MDTLSRYMPVKDVFWTTSLGICYKCQPNILFDTSAQPTLECPWIDSYTHMYYTSASLPWVPIQFKVATLYSIHTYSRCVDVRQDVYPMYYPRRDEGSGKPCAVERTSQNTGTRSGLEPETSAGPQSTEVTTTLPQHTKIK